MSGATPNHLPGEVVLPAVAPANAQMTDEELNQQYIDGDIRIVTEQARYPLREIRRMLLDRGDDSSGHGEFIYKRNPEYQRRHRWSNNRKSRLIESLLMNVPVPPVFLYEYELSRFEVMDGRQRLSAIDEFYSGDLTLSGLEYWRGLEGRTYHTLPGKVRDGIDRRYLSSVILLKETAEDDQVKASLLKKLVFDRLNTGGVKLAPQESRNAIYDGPLNQLCLELSRLTPFRRILGTPEELPDPVDNPNTDDSDPTLPPSADGVTEVGTAMYSKMDDVELVLRFFAYRHLDKFPAFSNRLSETLDYFLESGNGFPDGTLDAYRELFTEVITFWWNLGGSEAFKVQLPGARSFSKIGYDSFMWAASELGQSDRATLLGKVPEVKAALAAMFAAHADDFSGRKTNNADAKRRNEIVVSTLRNVI